MKKEIIIFLISYVIATLIRGFIIFNTEISLDIFKENEFYFIPFLVNFMIWILSYTIVRLIITKLF